MHQLSQVLYLVLEEFQLCRPLPAWPLSCHIVWHLSISPLHDAAPGQGRPGGLIVSHLVPVPFSLWLRLWLDGPFGLQFATVERFGFRFLARNLWEVSLRFLSWRNWLLPTQLRLLSSLPIPFTFWLSLHLWEAFGLREVADVFGFFLLNWDFCLPCQFTQPEDFHRGRSSSKSQQRGSLHRGGWDLWQSLSTHYFAFHERRQKGGLFDPLILESPTGVIDTAPASAI